MPSMSYVAYGMRQGPVSNILRRVQIAVVLCATLVAYPHPICKGEAVSHRSAVVAGLRAGVEPIHLDNFLPIGAGEVFEDGNETMEAEVADLPTPESFHPVEVEVFD